MIDTALLKIIKYLSLLNSEILMLLNFMFIALFLLIIYKTYKLYGLIAFNIACIILSNIQIIKIGNIDTFNTYMPLGTIVFSFAVFSSDILVEKYNSAIAIRVIGIGFLISIFICISMLFIIAHPYPSFADKEHKAIATIFSPSLRILISSLIAYATSQFINIVIFNVLKNKMQKKYLWFRSNFAIFISSMIDSLVFNLLAWNLLSNAPFNLNTILISFFGLSQLLRMACAICATPFFYIIRNIKTNDI